MRSSDCFAVPPCIIADRTTCSCRSWLRRDLLDSAAASKELGERTGASREEVKISSRGRTTLRFLGFLAGGSTITPLPRARLFLMIAAQVATRRVESFAKKKSEVNSSLIRPGSWDSASQDQSPQLWNTGTSRVEGGQGSMKK